jgi:hypothetical protein
MNASLVFDGGSEVRIPESMGTPSADQMKGTPAEQLGEVACRICYDSLGSGRSSEALHKHILEVINLSVYEHFQFTVGFTNIPIHQILQTLMNRKGVWIKIVEPDESMIDVTINFRTILEWNKCTRSGNINGRSQSIRYHLQKVAHSLAPMIVPMPEDNSTGEFEREKGVMLIDSDRLDPDQAWVSLWLYGSRGFTHEQVRHRFAISQRSTRYVDETDSPYIIHPLITKWLNDKEGLLTDKVRATTLMTQSVEADRKTYIYLVEQLQAYSMKQGLDRTNARKQARGAARGYLGNALASEMIFSAPVTGWRHILRQRASKFADAEIRTIYTPALKALKSSRYGGFFADLETVPAPDGMGEVLA